MNKIDKIKTVSSERMEIFKYKNANVFSFAQIGDEDEQH